MPHRKWKSISQEVISSNPWWSYRRHRIELPGGKQGEYHAVHTEGSSMVIPVLDSGEVLLVSQYRYLNDRESLEFPCGGVKNGHSYVQTAAQELAEEAGLAAGELRQIGEFNPYNGVTDEICRVYVARTLRRVEVPTDETESFERHTLSIEELDRRIRDGEIWDGMTLAAWGLARPHLVTEEKS